MITSPRYEGAGRRSDDDGTILRHVAEFSILGSILSRGDRPRTPPYSERRDTQPIAEMRSTRLRLPTAGECVRFERESFGALHQMMAGLAEPEREATWQEISHELEQFEIATGFEGPCELLVCVGVK